MITSSSSRPFAAYLAIVAGWFFSFGLQTTLYPGVVYFTLGESPERLGLAQMALTLPMLLLLPAAGVLAERRGRRKLLIIFYGMAAAAAVTLATLLATGSLSYPLLIIYALGVGSCGAFVLPARDSAINPVVQLANRTGHPITLQKAVILTTIAQFGAQIAGMAAGYATRWTGPAIMFAVQSGGFALGMAAAFQLPRLRTRRRDKPHVLRDLVDGVKAVFTSPVLGPMTWLMIAVGFFVVGGGFFVIIPVLVRDIYGGGYSELSSLLVVFWIGALLANLVLARFGAIERPGLVIIVAQMVTVASLGLIALHLPFWGLYVLDLGWGLGAGVAISLSRAVVQENAPSDMVARVMSVYQLGLFGGMPVGAALMGFIVAALGPHTSALIPMAGLGLFLVWLAVATPLLKVGRAAKLTP